MGQNWMAWFSRSPREVERRESVALLRRVRSAQYRSPLATEESISEFIIDLVMEACKGRATVPGVPLGAALYQAIHSLLHHDAIIGTLPTEDEVESASIEEGVRLRAALRRSERFLAGHSRLLPLWRQKMLHLLTGILGYFPDSAFVDVDDEGNADDDSIVLPRSPAYELCERLPELLTRTMRTFVDDDISEAQLFEAVRETLFENLYRASGIAPEDWGDRRARVILPNESKLTEPSALVDAYLDGTALQDFFRWPLPFAIPFPARFEHTHVVGGTGHGKTQLLQFLIHHDLVRSREDGRSIVVIDSQGDLIRTISHLGLWEEPTFRERFVLVDPNDVEHPVCLNMFDWSRDRLSGYAPVDQEKILNATVELYEYFFGALLGAELTQRQGLIFRYLARLLIEIPDATVHTLRELMEDGNRFRPYMEQLGGTARHFFATQFFDRKFGETKKQILTRLWGVLANSSLERMFSHTNNRIDLFSLLNEGRIVLINTAKDLLGRDGSAIFGRFFIALLAQAAIQRTPMPSHTRRPAFVYIDEAQEYFDESIDQLLAQARKYRLGLVFAHQHMDQLNPGLKSSVLASTSIKFAGGVSAKDAALLDSEMRCTQDFLLERRKGKRETEFACFVKHHTGQAIAVSIPLGFVESKPEISVESFEDLLAENRALYSEPPQLPTAEPDTTVPSNEPAAGKAPRTTVIPAEAESQAEFETSEPTVVASPEHASKPRARRTAPDAAGSSGRGGRQHKYVQQMVKQLAESHGFRATIEEAILEGAGRVDVSLVRGGRRVACQVSITTTKDWELAGVEKCLAAGYDEVLLIATSERHVKTLRRFIEENLDESSRGKVRYLAVEGLVEYFGQLDVPEPSESTVRGYKVRTTQHTLDPDESALRRKAVAQVVARSLRKGTPE